jgi:hypothetical protein
MPRLPDWFYRGRFLLICRIRHAFMKLFHPSGYLRCRRCGSHLRAVNPYQRGERSR